MVCELFINVLNYKVIEIYDLLLRKSLIILNNITNDFAIFLIFRESHDDLNDGFFGNIKFRFSAEIEQITFKKKQY